MTRKEKKELWSEYLEFSKTHYYGNGFNIPMFFGLIASLLIFIVPENILSAIPFLKYFTIFMGDMFPNIDIYSKASDVPERTEFYFSYTWMICIVMIFMTIRAIPKVNEEAKKFFGIDEYKNKGVFLMKYSSVIQSFINVRYLFTAFAVALIISWSGIYASYTGYILEGGISRLRFDEAISTRFGMLILANLQNQLIFLVIITIVTDYMNTMYIIKLKKGQ